jgi:RNA 2',3'-cyclic 3'-phosphodiesterase
MRTFIAIPLPPECHALLEELQTGMRQTGADVRWTAIRSIHLTLKFLGEIDAELVPELGAKLRADLPAQPFPLRVGGVGGFPNLRSPRVIWCGIQGDLDALGRLQARVEETCAVLGFAPEDRAFQPHLTLGRVQGKRNLQSLLDYIKIGSVLEHGFTVDRFNVYKSVLTPKGPLYTVLDTVELKRSSDS